MIVETPIGRPGIPDEIAETGLDGKDGICDEHGY